MSNTNIPSFNDICGTVTQALAETIINRENLIVQLREENANLKSALNRRNNRADFRCCNEQKSDSDPATGVQYGDLH